AYSGLTPADGLVLVDAHPGNTVNALRAINPAVNNENRPDLLQSKLDPFNPKNGYNPNGDSHYGPEFQKAYTSAQARRFNEWIDHALYVREQIKQGKWIYPDNDDITIGRGGGSQAGGGSGANLFVMDPTISCCTNQPAKLLKDNGTIVTQIIKSVRIGDPTRAVGNASFDDGAKDLTVTSFLSANAIRATDSLDNDQIDWCSSNNSTPCALRVITKPLLITNMGALYRPDPARFPSPHVGVIAMHRNSNYMSHISTKELPARGFVVLGMNPRCDNNEAACTPWENNALDVKSGVNYLRSQGMTKVVLLGHSGGGPTMSFYQAVAEQG